jgi:hypothetical protein
MIRLGTFIAPHAFQEMETHRTRALRRAHLYGCLINRTGRLYYPGGNADGGGNGESWVARTT